MKKIYIAGKISGLSVEDYTNNFAKAERYLFGKGYEPVNPLDFTTENMSWNECIKICLEVLERCDGIYLMRNWKDSKGARLEYKKAIAMQKINKDFEIIFE